MRKAILSALGLMLVCSGALAQDKPAETKAGEAAQKAAGAVDQAAAATNTTTTAAAASTPPGGPKYGTAGCGLGSILFGAKPGIVQIFAATTNATSATQTFGITSGTSNCVDAEGGANSAKAFVETNREALAKDIARGSGETISSLSSLAGCGNDKAVGAKLQKSYKKIFPNARVSSGAVGDSVITTLKSDATLACRNLG
ncbi:MAG TPA: DUF3015 family protein [Polyangiaceae bacterium]|nr:DUF3015 family protein [Polyangiaceae bacterium]